jgi:hypothetical protein
MFPYETIDENVLHAKLPLYKFLARVYVSVVTHCLQFVVSDWFTVCKPVMLYKLIK